MPVQLAKNALILHQRLKNTICIKECTGDRNVDIRECIGQHNRIGNVQGTETHTLWNVQGDRTLHIMQYFREFTGYGTLQMQGKKREQRIF